MRSPLILATKPTKKERKKTEMFIRKHISSNMGDVLGKVNNILDSEENVQEAIDPLVRLEHVLNDVTVNEGLQLFEKGDHIATMRSVYSHHGIYDGRGGVYEYNEGKIRFVTLKKFANGDNMYRVDEDTIYTPEKVVKRAKSRIGEEEYNLIYNNCENFATWCRLGS